MWADTRVFVAKDPGTGTSSLQSVAESSRSWAAPSHWSIGPYSFRRSYVLRATGHNRGLVQSLQVAPGSFSREYMMALTAPEISGLVSSCLQDAEKL